MDEIVLHQTGPKSFAVRDYSVGRKKANGVAAFVKSFAVETFWVYAASALLLLAVNYLFGH